MSTSTPWRANYSGSHNVYFDFPPLMSDGRNFAGWQREAPINAQIRKNNNISSNWDYRQYLTHNAEKIIDTNYIDAVNEAGHSPFEVPNGQKNTPFMFSSVMDERRPIGYESSDLKEIYLSRNQLQSRMISPSITQDQLLKFQATQQFTN
jgi:hypothetical protein